MITMKKKGVNKMPWDLKPDSPIYLQLMEKIQLSIISGKYKAGDKLPSVRDLAAEAAVNPNTMQKALTELERIGLVYSQRTSGRFITEDNTMIQDAKRQLAKEVIQDYLIKMKQIGYEENEAAILLQTSIKGMQV